MFNFAVNVIGGKMISKTQYPFKVASITTVSLRLLLDLFKTNIVEIDAQSKFIQKSKPENIRSLGIRSLEEENNSFYMRYNSRTCDNLTPSNIQKILNVLDKLRIEDVAVQRFIIKIKDKKLGELCREALSEVVDFNLQSIPLVRRIPLDEDLFYATFYNDPCEKDEELKKLVHKPNNLKYFVLNLKELINEWQIRNLPAKYNKHLQLPPRLKIIDIRNWNWKANYLPESYLSSAPIVDYIKDKYLPERFRCEKNFKTTNDNKIILTNFGR